MSIRTRSLSVTVPAVRLVVFSGYLDAEREGEIVVEAWPILGVASWIAIYGDDDEDRCYDYLVDMQDGRGPRELRDAEQEWREGTYFLTARPVDDGPISGEEREMLTSVLHAKAKARALAAEKAAAAK